MSQFNVIFHHDGVFVRENFILYRGGVETLVSRQDSDKWLYFEALSLVKEWGYDGSGVRLWRKIEGIDEGLFHMNDDFDVPKVENHSISNNIDVHI